MKWAPRARQVMGFLTVDLCRLVLGELCDIIQELEQGLELRLVTVTVTVIVIVIAWWRGKTVSA